MSTLIYVQVIDTITDLTRKKELVWKPQEATRFKDLEPEVIIGKMYLTRFKDRNLLLYEERTPPYTPENANTRIRLQFVDDYGAIAGDFPDVSGFPQLYALITYQNRDPVAIELDRVVEAIAMETRKGKLIWMPEKPERYGLDADMLTSPVYSAEFKGKRFIIFYEHATGSTLKNVQTHVTMWILDENNHKRRDFADVLGVEVLFRYVNTQQTQLPDFTQLDTVIDGMVSTAIKDVMTKMAVEMTEQKQEEKHGQQSQQQQQQS
jgi:hypothetical protein